MRYSLLLASLSFASPLSAQTQDALEADFSGSLRGCEEWVLNPASWSEGPGPFLATVGLGEKIGLVKEVDNASLPPPGLREANHYWRINSSPTVGIVLVVSDRLPMCHITGGGDRDMQPAIEAVLISNAFLNRWEAIGRKSKGDMTSTVFRNRAEPTFSITISRAEKAGERLDRVQIIATASYDLKK